MTSILFRIGFIAALIVGFLLFLVKNNDRLIRLFGIPQKTGIQIKEYVRTYEPVSEGQLLQKSSFSLSYNPKTKNPDWVAYHLTKEQLVNTGMKLRSVYLPDPQVKTGLNINKDYIGNGFEPGHLVPAEDMAFDSVSYNESFLFTAIVPQRRGFNFGIWKELDMQTRHWVSLYQDVYIISGPVYQYNDKIPVLKNTQTAIPSHFFKIILVYNQKMIGMKAFMMPNETSVNPLSFYSVTVDQIETLTGIDFFQNMLENEEEERLESTIHTSAFPLDETFFRQRIEKWNAL